MTVDQDKQTDVDSDDDGSVERSDRWSARWRVRIRIAAAFGWRWIRKLLAHWRVTTLTVAVVAAVACRRHVLLPVPPHSTDG